MNTLSISRSKLKQVLQQETQRFEKAHPKSKQLFNKAQRSLLGGVPMPWMIRWPGGFPLFATEAIGAEFKDVDGHHYVDFCLGDTGAMTGHAPQQAAETIASRAQKGITMMLPTEDSVRVAQHLQKRFGLPYWQMANSATDANRFVLRLARMITGRQKILVFSWCYHGTVDETLVVLEKGKVVSRGGAIGVPIPPSETTEVVEFNDIQALENALKKGNIAAVLCEPAMTNIGIILPQKGYHDALRKLTKKYKTLLIIDETHTLSTGYGGYTKTYGLEPDMFVLGKPIASGIPCAVYGLSEQVAHQIQKRVSKDDIDVSGIGGTLAGNALAIATMATTLEKVLTKEAYQTMIPLAQKWADGVATIIRQYHLPWSVTRLGARAEYRFHPHPPLNGGESAASNDFELEKLTHLAALNRGILLTPFHNMALMSPATKIEHIELHNRVFEDTVQLVLSCQKKNK